MKKIATFNRFEISFKQEDIDLAYHMGDCGDGVEEVCAKDYIQEQFKGISTEKIRTELKEYGAWDDIQLADDQENQQRIIWIGAANIQEEEE